MSAPSEIASLKDRIKELEDELIKVRTQLKFVMDARYSYQLPEDISHRRDILHRKLALCECAYCKETRDV